MLLKLYRRGLANLLKQLFYKSLVVTGELKYKADKYEQIQCDNTLGYK